MSSTASPRAARSRERLLRAATDLLVEAGPRGVTVDAVAEASGVAKSTLYRHWPSRDEMLVDVVRCNIPTVTEADLSEGFETALRWYVSDAASTLADPEWSRIIPAMMSLQITMPEVAACIETDRTSKTAVLRKLLAAGVEQAVLPADVDAEMASRILFGPLIYCALLGDRERLGDVAVEVVDRFLASYAH